MEYSIAVTINANEFMSHMPKIERLPVVVMKFASSYENISVSRISKVVWGNKDGGRLGVALNMRTCRLQTTIRL